MYIYVCVCCHPQHSPVQQLLRNSSTQDKQKARLERMNSVRDRVKERVNSLSPDEFQASLAELNRQRSLTADGAAPGSPVEGVF